MRIVFLLADSLRKDHVGCYGNDWLACSNLARLAERAVVFTAARAARADCLAVRRELMAGTALVGAFKDAGYVTGLVADHQRAVGFYRTLGDFDFVLPCAGQADDPTLRSASDLSGPWENHYQPVAPAFAPDADALARYVRNQAAGGGAGHATERLFAEAAACLAGLADRENVFLLIDSFALLPPWHPPDAFATYRDPRALHKLAWLSPATVPTEKLTTEQVTFLRCAYADSCLFYDHALGTLLDAVDSVDGVHFFLASDHGLLIGDHGQVGCDDGMDYPVVTDQVLLVSTPDGPAGLCDDPVGMADVSASMLALARVTSSAGEGRIVDAMAGR